MLSPTHTQSINQLDPAGGDEKSSKQNPENPLQLYTCQVIRLHPKEREGHCAKAQT